MGDTAANTTSAGAYLQLFLPLILLFFCLWFFMIRPQKKRDNETRKMRSSIQEGDEIVTIGGIVGKVLSVKEDSLIIYCGADKTKMEFKKWAVSEVTKKVEKPVKEKEADLAETEDETPKKKNIKKLSRREDAEEDTAEDK
ncbi:MAG: preprotein translocase subunit YajC [Firmicutes bacterium]|nr:preprotein translocase subunit YajC [Bacillota bacterium]